jgi:CBS domain containing-hemolysin-like protein
VAQLDSLGIIRTMKRVATIFAVNYISMVLLFAFLFLVAPDVFPGSAPLTGADRILDWIARPVGWFTFIYTFPFIFIAEYAAPVLPSVAWLSALICLLIPAALWTGIFIYARRYWRVHHAA